MVPFPHRTAPVGTIRYNSPKKATPSSSGTRSFERANALCQRFRNELGYAYADPFSIHEKGKGSRTMYYMIHASDHPRAVTLMSQAYRKVGGDRHMGGEQIPLL